MSGWEIAIVAVLVLALAIGIVVLVAYLVEAERRPPPGQDPDLPLIVFRDPKSLIEPGRITIRPPGAPQRKPTRELIPRNDEHQIEKREVKDDVDLYCKLTGRIVRVCSCEDCRKLRRSLGI